MSRSETVRCPKCGGEMERGYLPVGMKGLLWSTKKHKWGASSLWQESVENLIGNKLRFYMVNVEAYRCVKCKLLLAYYGKIEEQARSEKGC
jgi:hypothetical protein